MVYYLKASGFGINKLIRVCSGSDRSKNVFADLSIKELLIRLMQSQYLEQVCEESATDGNAHRLHYVIDHIRENLTNKILIEDLTRIALLSRNNFFKLFRHHFGVTPLEYINNERIKLAKKLLLVNKYTISEVSDYCGFNDLNYFVRLFRKTEGITPGAYRACLSSGGVRRA